MWVLQAGISSVWAMLCATLLLVFQYISFGNLHTVDASHGPASWSMGGEWGKGVQLRGR